MMKMTKFHKDRMEHDGYEAAAKKYAPGEGGRFKAMTSALKGKVRDPAAVAASIGRRKYGKKRMAGWAAKGRRDAR